jgi:hypothetical protein
MDAKALLELQILEDVDSTRNTMAKITYKTADNRPLVETVERLFEERLINIRKVPERGGQHSATILDGHGDVRLEQLRAKFAAEIPKK